MPQPWWMPGVLQRLVDREIRVVELHVLADEADVDLAAALGDALGELGPLAELGRLRREPELLADHLIEPLGLQLLRDEVDIRHVAVDDDSLRLEVREHRDLVAQVVRKLVLRAADDDVRVDSDPAQLIHRVLRRLRLQLACRVDERYVRDVEVEHVLRAGLAPELPDRLEERQRLDVAHGPSDLADHDVGRRCVRRAADPLLDLVRDVRDHLNGRPEVLALALLAQHRVPDRARGVVRVA